MRDTWPVTKLTLLASLLALAGQMCLADPVVLSVSGLLTGSDVNGVQVGAGDYTLAQLASAASAAGQVGVNGQSGIPLWSLLGGNAAGASAVSIATPDGFNGKNAILRSYVLATTLSGAHSVISLGEIDPLFGGTGTVPYFLSTSGTDGRPSLIFPGMAARNISDVVNLQILAAPALQTTSGGLSTSFALSGNVNRPGTYAGSDLQSLPTTTATIMGDKYTGVLLSNLLNPNSSSVFDQYVLASGTDGYQVLFSLAELDPRLGGRTSLIAYADTQGQFPSNGFSRIAIEGDNRAGRYVSNLDSLSVVTAVPEPKTLLLFVIAAPALYLARRTRRRKVTSLLVTRSPQPEAAR